MVESNDLQDVLNNVINGVAAIGFVAALLFPIIYTWKARWWETQYGRHLFWYSVIVAALYSVIILRIYVVTPIDHASDPTWFYWYRAIVYTSTAYMMWRQIWIFFRAQSAGRKRALEKAAKAQKGE